MYIGRSQKVFEPDPNPKISPEKPQKCKNAPNLAELKQKYRVSLSKQKFMLYIIRLQKCFNPGPNPKNNDKAPKMPQSPQKSAKEVPNVAELKQKDRAVLPKAKLSVYIGRSQKSF